MFYCSIGFFVAFNPTQHCFVGIDGEEGLYYGSSRSSVSKTDIQF